MSQSNQTLKEILEHLHYSAWYSENKEPYRTNQINIALKEISELIESCIPEKAEYDNVDIADPDSYNEALDDMRNRLREVSGE